MLQVRKQICDEELASASIPINASWNDLIVSEEHGSDSAMGDDSESSSAKLFLRGYSSVICVTIHVLYFQLFLLRIMIFLILFFDLKPMPMELKLLLDKRSSLPMLLSGSML